MESKYTPGPWRYDHSLLNAESSTGQGSICTDEDSPWFIATIEDGPNPEADAALIASAPELASVLVQLLNSIADAGSNLTTRNGAEKPIQESVMRAQEVMRAAGIDWS